MKEEIDWLIDIVDGDVKMILSLVWKIVLKAQIDRGSTSTEIQFTEEDGSVRFISMFNWNFST